MSGNRLLIVDDDPAVRRVLAEYLAGHGFEIAEADGGAAMRERLQAQVPDLVLLDLGLPGEDGLSLARYLREHFTCGIVMVTGAGGTVDRIVGLEVGADDYIAKPFEPRELLARIKSVLRRLRPAPAPGAAPTGRRVRVGRCEIDLASRRLTDRDGNDVALTAMEFDLLRAFLDHPNQVLTRDRLLNLTRDRDWEPFDRSIDIRITRLRRKIEPDPDSPRVIQTVRGAGYMYVPAASD
jgi:two-component system phosphate regulon response regulator OmpR